MDLDWTDKENLAGSRILISAEFMLTKEDIIETIKAEKILINGKYYKPPTEISILDGLQPLVLEQINPEK